MNWSSLETNLAELIADQPLESFFHAYGYYFLTLIARYVAISGVFFLVFYILFKKATHKLKIQPAFAKRAYIRQDILFSVSTFTIVAFIYWWSIWLIRNDYTLLYFEVGRYGWLYFILSFFIYAFLKDTYLYWMHRLMHTRWMYSRFHSIHHHSTNPTPWSAYAFHPIEAIVTSIITPILLLVFPAHILVIAFWSITEFIDNIIIGHGGYELFPSWALRSPILKLFNNATCHNLHHTKYQYNYGLYFNIWDRITGTLHPDFEKTFDEVVARRKKTS